MRHRFVPDLGGLENRFLLAVADIPPGTGIIYPSTGGSSSPTGDGGSTPAPTTPPTSPPSS